MVGLYGLEGLIRVEGLSLKVELLELSGLRFGV